jgi:anti-sigma factor RsiW
MNCKDLLSRLDDYLDARLDRDTAVAVESHLAGCASCSAHARVERLLRERLQALPAPAPPKGYSRRVLAGASAMRRVVRKPRRAAPAYRLAAASVLLVVVAGWMLFETGVLQGGIAREPVVTVHGGQIQRIKLVFNSPGELSGVTLRVGLPDGVELVEYPGVRELTWQADLKPGANLLALPVIVRGDGGTVVASVSFGAEQKQFSVTVHASGHTGASLGPGAAGAELLAYCPVAARRDIIAHA